MDDVPRANTNASAFAVGLLVLMGVGCGQGSNIQQSQLVIADDQRSRSYVAGVSEVCDFKNASVMFPKSVDWSKAADAIKEKEQQGWALKKFCYLQWSGGGLVMERNTQQHSLLIGFISEIGSDPAIYFSEPFTLSQAEKYDGEWDLKISETEGVKIIQTTTHNHDLSDGWLQRETYSYAAGGTPENAIMSIETCAQQNSDRPEILNKKIPLCKN